MCEVFGAQVGLHGAAIGEEFGAQAVAASSSLWATLGVPLLAGRTFSESEAVDPETDAVLINRRLAERLWPGGVAVGGVVRYATPSASMTGRVVGVAPDLV